MVAIQKIEIELSKVLVALLIYNRLSVTHIPVQQVGYFLTAPVKSRFEPRIFVIIKH